MCNTFIIFAANATCFSLLFLAFNFLESFNLNSMKWVILFSVFGSVFYSVILANALIVCNLALVSSGVHKDGGFMSILKACVLIRGKTSTALALAVPINIGLAAVEALFHFRIIASFTTTTTTTTSASFVALEGVLIAYIYSILLVLDVIMSCMLYQYCEFDHGFLGQNNQRYDYINSVMEVEEDCYYDYDVEKLKGIEEFV
ncbi:Cyclic pyranopterin monophosphate synthase [Bienertia sinuspersici]